MSDLQIGLLLLGIVIVAGVVAFNWWQERQFRRRTERSFNRAQPDVLLEPRVEPASVAATEPWMEEPEFPPEPDSVAEQPSAPAVPPRPDAGRPQQPGASSPVAQESGQAAQIDFVAELRAGEVIPGAAIGALETALATLGRRVTLSGYDYHAQRWEPLAGTDRWYTSLRAALQLADRNGAATHDQIQQFAGIVRDHATRIAAIAELPDPDMAEQMATNLDEFCGDVDVIVGINVIAQTGQVFHGTQIRAWAESQGMKLQPSGVFVLPGAGGKALFALDNQDAQSFGAEQMRNLTTSGVTFLLDVPRTADGIKVFDRMVAMSRHFAESLDGMLADDNRALLNDVGLDKIRNQLRAIYAMMAQRGIPAGSSAAQRLFS